MAVVVLSAAALAWACSPQAAIGLSSGNGRVGERTTVTGSGFTAAETEIHWNSLSGPVIGSATGRSFTVEVTIPEAAPDVYYIVAVNAEGRASAPVEVVASSSADTPAEPGAGPGESPGAAPGGTTAPSGKSKGGSARGDSESNSRSRSDSGRANDGGPAPGTRTRAGTDRGRHGTALQSEGGPSPAAGTDSGTVTTGSGQRVFAGSVKPDRGSGPRAAKDPRTGSPSQASAAGDLWGGFASAREPSLTAPDGGALPDDAPGSQFAVGTGILGLGLVGLFGGFLVAAMRRRRVAGSNSM